MWVWALQLCRQTAQPDTGCGCGVWLTCPYRSDGALKKHNTSAIWVAAPFGVVEFSSRDFRGKVMSSAASAPAIRGQNLCVERMKPLSKWINQCQGLRRNGTELIPFLCKPFVPCQWISSSPWSLPHWASMKCKCRNWGIIPLSIPHGNIAGDMKNWSPVITPHLLDHCCSFVLIHEGQLRNSPWNWLLSMWLQGDPPDCFAEEALQDWWCLKDEQRSLPGSGEVTRHQP